MKIRPVGDELFHADVLTNGQRYDEANSIFSRFWERDSNLVPQVIVF
jgi:hypothetical protein